MEYVEAVGVEASVFELVAAARASVLKRAKARMPAMERMSRAIWSPWSRLRLRSKGDAVAFVVSRVEGIQGGGFEPLTIVGGGVAGFVGVVAGEADGQGDTAEEVAEDAPNDTPPIRVRYGVGGVKRKKRYGSQDATRSGCSSMNWRAFS